MTSALLKPAQAIAYLDEVVRRVPQIAVVGIAGPGDPFANAIETLETLKLVRDKYPDMLLCVASNGLNLGPHVDWLCELQVSHVTLTINAVEPEIAGKIYAWVRHDKKVYRGAEAGRIIIERQLNAIRALKAAGITVKINTIIVPGVNDEHVVEVVRTVAALGADVSNCIPVYPVEGTPFAKITPPSDAEVAAIREQAGEYLPLMYHCTRCRADAVGLLGKDMPLEILDCLRKFANGSLVPDENRPFVAVATEEGSLVNMHLGEAQNLLIYGKQDDGFELVESRTTPPRGQGNARWEELGNILKDCRAILCSSVGETPRRALEAQGIRTVMMEGLIEEGLDAVFENRSVRAPLRREHSCGTGAGCSGNGMGCM